MEFGGADEGEVLGVEEEDDVFLVDELLEAEVLDDVFSLYGFSGEGRGGLLTTWCWTMPSLSMRKSPR